MKEHGTTKEEVEGPTSSWGLRNRITLLTLQERDDDDEVLICAGLCEKIVFIDELYRWKEWILLYSVNMLLSTLRNQRKAP